MKKQLVFLVIGVALSACEAEGPRRMDPEQVLRAMSTYYNGVDDSSPANLRSTLHDTIDDHQRFPFTSTALDTWNILELADEDPNNTSNIIDVYRNASYPKAGGGNANFNREHTWPSSFGFPNDNSSNYPYSDTHALFLTDSGYNSARSNRPFRTCNASCTEDPTVLNNGQGGGAGLYPGNSNWRSGTNSTGTWETWRGRRGDVARAVMYLDVRYEGGNHIGGAAEPNLILTNNQTLIAASNTGANEPVAYMGELSELIRWHVEDPVDAIELARNDVVFSFQTNRNPFVDHPEWVACAFSNVCQDTTAPVAPGGVVAMPTSGRVDLDWTDSSDPNLLGYFVYRSTTAGGPYTRTNVALATVSNYADGGVSNGTPYFYVVTAIDVAGNESTFSAEVSATPSTGGGGGAVWINEFHYDNAGGDTGEFVEVAGAAGTDLSGWTVVGYNGSNGTPYNTISLSGIIADQGGCMGTLGFNFSSLQNGAPDGLALVNGAGTVIEFISYEGTIVASSGAASGMTSVDVGVAESSSTPVGSSLARNGTGSTSGDFTWQPPAPNTRGAVNAGQTFDACSGGCTNDPDCDDGQFCNGAESCIATVCQAGSPPSVDDGVACTVDSCNETTDTIVNAPNNSACTNGLYCDGVESCDVVAGCLAGTAVNCDDGVACTIDTCNEGTDACDVTLDHSACDDTTFCNGAEQCTATGCFAGTDPCPGQSCDESINQCVSCVLNGDCDDGLFCNGAEVCNAGACGAGTAPSVDDGIGCTVDSCDETNDTIVNTPNDTICDNGLFCDGVEFCDPVLDCRGTSAVDCSALDDACNVGVCDEVGDQCSTNPRPAGTSCVDGDACTSNDQCDGAGLCTGTNVCGGPNLETVSMTSVSGWSTVALASTYTSMVVVCTPSYTVTQTPAVVRVRNASGASFEVSTMLANGTNAAVGGVGVSCLVVEEGVYTAAIDGVTMEAVRYNSTVTDFRGSYLAESRSVANAYTNPVVVGQVMSANDPGWSAFWSRGNSVGSPPSSSVVRVGKMVAEDTDTTRVAELIGYVIIESGAGTIGGRSYSAALGADTIRGVQNGAPFTYGVSGLANATVAVASQAAMDGNNGGWAVLYGTVSATSLPLAIDEDQIRDSERRHTTEQVAYIVVD